MKQIILIVIKDEDAITYTRKYINIIIDKLCLINAVSDSIDGLMEDLDVDMSNDMAVEKLKDFKSVILKSINKFNPYVKKDTKKKDIEKKNIQKKDIQKKDTKNNNNKPDMKLATSDDTKAYIIDKQKLLKKRYKSLLETKKTIKDNTDSVNNAFKKLPKESQLKLIELIRLDTLLNDSIIVIWREIYERNKKSYK